jgi:hypothetical protein
MYPTTLQDDNTEGLSMTYRADVTTDWCYATCMERTENDGNISRNRNTQKYYLTTGKLGRIICRWQFAAMTLEYNLG